MERMEWFKENALNTRLHNRACAEKDTNLCNSDIYW